jgi:electron transfer flavoprotein alpha subunit
LKGDILVLSEQKGEELDNITYELLTKGREIADQWEKKLIVLVLGSNTDVATKLLTGMGIVDDVLVVDDPVLHDHNTEAYCKVISRVVKNFSPTLFLVGYTFLGMEVGPSVAASLNIPMISNCVDLEFADDTLMATRPMHNGTLHAKLNLQGEVPYIISFQKGALPRQGRGSILKETTISLVKAEIGEAALRSKVIGIVETLGDIDITKAEVIVSAGRGIGDKANIKLLKDLADVLGGTVAGSRAVVDMGWLPLEYQVGISGKTVTPKIYFACGISGASHHVAGMRDSDTIIAINKDPNAPIFSVAHYGIVGDVLELLPVITEEARRQCH